MEQGAVVGLVFGSLLGLMFLLSCVASVIKAVRDRQRIKERIAAKEQLLVAAAEMEKRLRAQEKPRHSISEYYARMDARKSSIGSDTSLREVKGAGSKLNGISTSERYLPGLSRDERQRPIDENECRKFEVKAELNNVARAPLEPRTNSGTHIAVTTGTYTRTKSYQSAMSRNVCCDTCDIDRVCEPQGMTVCRYDSIRPPGVENVAFDLEEGNRV